MFAPEGSQLVTLATQREQAKLIWGMSDRMRLVSDPRLTEGVTKTVQAISNVNNWTRYVPLSKESKRLDGLNIRLAIADEAAAIDNANLFEVVTSSMGNQVSPQIVMITTGQPGAKSNYFYQQLDYAKKVLDGLIDDQRIFTLAYQIDEHDDWKEPKNWQKANPNLGVSVHESFLEEELKKALEVPSLAANFRTKYLNQFISTSSAWISTDRWKQSTIPAIRTDLPLYVGLDLGSTSDLTAVTQVFAANDEFYVRTKCFVPEEAFRNSPKHVRNVYDAGVQSGSLVITEGDVADHPAIRDYIQRLSNQYDLREVAFDPWSAVNLSSMLQESGLTMVKFPQSMGAMSPASKDTELLIRTGKLMHEDDPFLEWQLNNCEVYTDLNGNIKVRKGNDQALKIDGIIAMIMAVGRATAQGARKPEKAFDFWIA
jgi:phage terminase large subunit-like protein